MIGSAGTLGAIAEVTLRTFARPADEQSLVIFCNGPQQAEEITAAVMTAPIEPAYIQAIGGHGFSDNLLQLPVSPIILVVGFLGRPEICAAQIAMLRSLPQLQDVECIAQNAAQAGRLRLWMTSDPAGSVSFRINALSSQVTTLIAAIQSAAKSAKIGCRIVAELGNGIVRGVLTAANPVAITGCWPSLQYLCDNHSAELVLLHVDPQISIGHRPVVRELHRRIKAGLDPQRTFGDLSAVM